MPRVEKVIDGYTGFFYYDENDMSLVAMYWQHGFKHIIATTIFIEYRC